MHTQYIHASIRLVHQPIHARIHTQTWRMIKNNPRRLPRLEVRKSGIENGGWGVFAGEDIPKVLHCLSHTLTHQHTLSHTHTPGYTHTHTVEVLYGYTHTHTHS